MKKVNQILKLIQSGYWEGSRSKKYIDDYIDYALSEIPFELLGCE